MKRTNLLVLLSIVTLLILVSLACNQAGEIISPVEATQRYLATQDASAGAAEGDEEGAIFLSGDKAILAGQGYLVGLYSFAGDTDALSFATRGDEVTVVGSTDYEGEIWSFVETMAGSGWLPEANLAPVE